MVPPDETGTRPEPQPVVIKKCVRRTSNSNVDVGGSCSRVNSTSFRSDTKKADCAANEKKRIFADEVIRRAELASERPCNKIISARNTSENYLKKRRIRRIPGNALKPTHLLLFILILLVFHMIVGICLGTSVSSRKDTSSISALLRRRHRDHHNKSIYESTSIDENNIYTEHSWIENSPPASAPLNSYDRHSSSGEKLIVLNKYNNIQGRTGPHQPQLLRSNLGRSESGLIEIVYLLRISSTDAIQNQHSLFISLIRKISTVISQVIEGEYPNLDVVGSKSFKRPDQILNEECVKANDQEGSFNSCSSVQTQIEISLSSLDVIHQIKHSIAFFMDSNKLHDDGNNAYIYMNYLFPVEFSYISPYIPKTPLALGKASEGDGNMNEVKLLNMILEKGLPVGSFLTKHETNFDTNDSGIIAHDYRNTNSLIRERKRSNMSCTDVTENCHLITGIIGMEYRTPLSDSEDDTDQTSRFNTLYDVNSIEYILSIAALRIAKSFFNESPSTTYKSPNLSAIVEDFHSYNEGKDSDEMSLMPTAAPFSASTGNLNQEIKLAEDEKDHLSLQFTYALESGSEYFLQSPNLYIRLATQNIEDEFLYFLDVEQKDIEVITIQSKTMSDKLPGYCKTSDPNIFCTMVTVDLTVKIKRFDLSKVKEYKELILNFAKDHLNKRVVNDDIMQIQLFFSYVTHVDFEFIASTTDVKLSQFSYHKDLVDFLSSHETMKSYNILSISSAASQTYRKFEIPSIDGCRRKNDVGRTNGPPPMVEECKLNTVSIAVALNSALGKVFEKSENDVNKDIINVAREFFDIDEPSKGSLSLILVDALGGSENGISSPTFHPTSISSSKPTRAPKPTKSPSKQPTSVPTTSSPTEKSLENKVIHALKAPMLFISDSAGMLLSPSKYLPIVIENIKSELLFSFHEYNFYVKTIEMISITSDAKTSVDEFIVSLDTKIHVIVDEAVPIATVTKLGNETLTHYFSESGTRNYLDTRNKISGSLSLSSTSPGEEFSENKHEFSITDPSKDGDSDVEPSSRGSKTQKSISSYFLIQVKGPKSKEELCPTCIMPKKISEQIKKGLLEAPSDGVDAATGQFDDQHLSSLRTLEPSVIFVPSKQSIQAGQNQLSGVIDSVDVSVRGNCGENCHTMSVKVKVSELDDITTSASIPFDEGDLNHIQSNIVHYHIRNRAKSYIDQTYHKNEGYSLRQYRLKFAGPVALSANINVEVMGVLEFNMNQDIAGLFESKTLSFLSTEFPNKAINFSPFLVQLNNHTTQKVNRLPGSLSLQEIEEKPDLSLNTAQDATRMYVVQTSVRVHGFCNCDNLKKIEEDRRLLVFALKYVIKKRSVAYAKGLSETKDPYFKGVVGVSTKFSSTEEAKKGFMASFSNMAKWQKVLCFVAIPLALLLLGIAFIICSSSKSQKKEVSSDQLIPFRYDHDKAKRRRSSIMINLNGMFKNQMNELPREKRRVRRSSEEMSKSNRFNLTKEDMDSIRRFSDGSNKVFDDITGDDRKNPLRGSINMKGSMSIRDISKLGLDKGEMHYSTRSFGASSSNKRLDLDKRFFSRLPKTSEGTPTYYNDSDRLSRSGNSRRSIHRTNYPNDEPEKLPQNDLSNSLEKDFVETKKDSRNFDDSAHRRRKRSDHRNKDADLSTRNSSHGRSSPSRPKPIDGSERYSRKTSDSSNNRRISSSSYQSGEEDTNIRGSSHGRSSPGMKKDTQRPSHYKGREEDSNIRSTFNGRTTETHREYRKNRNPKHRERHTLPNPDNSSYRGGLKERDRHKNTNARHKTRYAPDDDRRPSADEEPHGRGSPQDNDAYDKKYTRSANKEHQKPDPKRRKSPDLEDHGSERDSKASIRESKPPGQVHSNPTRNLLAHAHSSDID